MERPRLRAKPDHGPVAWVRQDLERPRAPSLQPVLGSGVTNAHSFMVVAKLPPRLPLHHQSLSRLGKAKAKAKADPPAGASIRRSRECTFQKDDDVLEYDPHLRSNICPIDGSLTRVVAMILSGTTT